MPSIEIKEDTSNEIKTKLKKLFQSGNLNFLIGSGASAPSVETLGNVENDVKDLFEKGKKEEGCKKLYEFLSAFKDSHDAIIDESDDETQKNVLNSYNNFLRVIEDILIERKTTILPKKANIFSTNYDVFVEKASETVPTIKFNDGFNRSPNLKNNFVLDSKSFYSSSFNCGNLYTYKVEIPTINLIKIHGSFTWQKQENDIVFKNSKLNDFFAKNETISNYSDEIDKFNKEYCLILPQKDKLRETLINRTYYDLLRIYANELDKENTVLMVFGFSFEDEHIYDITQRALKNPTLQMVVFAYEKTAQESLESKFENYRNVTVIHPEPSEKIDFDKFNSIISIKAENQEDA